VCVAASGCVQRRLLIRSDPPGAVVYVDDYEVGTTPASTSFTYYGTRKIRLVKDGCETLTVMQSIPPPWYQIPPLDFITENFVPGKIRDRQQLYYRLEPQRVVPTEQLLREAEELRGRARSTGLLRWSAGPSGSTPPSTGPGTYPLPGPAPSGGRPVHPLPPGGTVRPPGQGGSW